MLAVELLVKEVVAMLNVAVVAPAATFAEAGTVRTELLLTRVKEAPPLGAGWDSVMVQVPAAFGPRGEGLQARVGLARPTTTAAR